MRMLTTFRQLETPSGSNPTANTGDSPLEIWYRSVRDKPVSNFTCNDLCKACRQALYPEIVVPIAVELLRKEPLAGEMYDGELLVALKSVNKEYWLTHPSLALEVMSITRSTVYQVDDETRAELTALISALRKNE